MARSSKRGSRRRVLLLSPATRFGSWVWIEKVIRASPPDLEWLVVSYGRPCCEPPNARFFTLPALVDYATLGRRLAARRLLALNILYYLPLAPLAWAVALWKRPSVLVANGVNASGILRPVTLFGPRLLLSFHGYLGHIGSRWDAVVRSGLRHCERAFVNSSGSRDDLSRLMPADRISIVHHWADEAFFRVRLERPPRERLVVLYVGRLDSEKFAQCARVCLRLAADGLVELRAVGAGPLAVALDVPFTRPLGYVEDVDRLAAEYANADVVWAPADTTYVSQPGVEGLAAGCPLVVSDIPAVDPRAAAGVRIPRDLLPDDIAHIVDGADDREATTLLRRLAEEGISLGRRRTCRRYARRHHSPANMHPVFDELLA